MTQPLHAKSGTDKTYELTFSNGVKWKPPAGTFPHYSINTLKEADAGGTIWFGKNELGIELRSYLIDKGEAWMIDCQQKSIEHIH